MYPQTSTSNRIGKVLACAALLFAWGTSYAAGESISGVSHTSRFVVTADNGADAEWERHYYIKSNLPAWACMWTNIGLEADMDPHWSADLSIYYSGFDYFRRDTKFRTFTVMPEIRYWPRRENDGFFVGAHFGICWYNVALRGAYRYQDHDGITPAVGGGVTAGYRIPFRNPRWKMEFALGAGIYSLDYDLFDNVANGRLVGRRQRTFYGIDRVAVSLCYTFGPSPKTVKEKGGTL